LAPTEGYYYPVITNAAAGGKGSQQIAKVQVDASGAGNSFVDATTGILNNGPKDPTTANAPYKLTVQLPEGTKCTGGTNKNLCLVSFTTTAGYGNCVVFSQDEAADTDAKQKTETDPSTGGKKTETNTNNGGKNTGTGSNNGGKNTGTGPTTGGKKRQSAPNPVPKKDQTAPAQKDQTAPHSPLPPPLSPSPSPVPSPVPNPNEYAKVPSNAANKIENGPAGHGDSSQNVHNKGGKRARGLRMARRV
ncbi:hypothetical protein DFH94DRAFT_483758, partial [Russula ochroleuca]